MLIKTKDLTKGERLLVERRRSGLTQGMMAGEYSISLYVYRKWELDEMGDAPSVGVGQLSEAEQYFLMRKRSGRSLNKVATSIGVCRWWLSQMEKGEVSIDKLRAYWAA